MSIPDAPTTRPNRTGTSARKRKEFQRCSLPDVFVTHRVRCFVSLFNYMRLTERNLPKHVHTPQRNANEKERHISELPEDTPRRLRCRKRRPAIRRRRDSVPQGNGEGGTSGIIHCSNYVKYARVFSKVG